jgi:hypothetical protein
VISITLRACNESYRAAISKGDTIVDLRKNDLRAKVEGVAEAVTTELREEQLSSVSGGKHIVDNASPVLMNLRDGQALVARSFDYSLGANAAGQTPEEPRIARLRSICSGLARLPAMSSCVLIGEDAEMVAIAGRRCEPQAADSGYAGSSSDATDS